MALLQAMQAGTWSVKVLVNDPDALIRMRKQSEEVYAAAFTVEV